MKLQELLSYIEGLFNTTDNEEFYKESGVTFAYREEIRKIGYCTNLTLDVIEEAAKNSVDMIITHHDAWDFIYGLKEACGERLAKYRISHYFNHLPLDDCDFGTNDTLLKRLGLKNVERTHLEEGFYCGRVAEYEEEIELEALVSRLEDILEEPVKVWKFNGRPIKRVGLVCGAGGFTPELRGAAEKNCDVYITGEKLLYTIEYAQCIGMNLIIGSHTFTELPGIESLAMKIAEGNEGIEIIRLKEEHLEVMGKY